MLAIIITGVECVIVPAHTWDYIRTPGTASSERCIRFGKCRAELVFLPRVHCQLQRGELELMSLFRCSKDECRASQMTSAMDLLWQ